MNAKLAFQDVIHLRNTLAPAKTCFKQIISIWYIDIISNREHKFFLPPINSHWLLTVNWGGRHIAGHIWCQVWKGSSEWDWWGSGRMGGDHRWEVGDHWHDKDGSMGASGTTGRWATTGTTTMGGASRWQPTTRVRGQSLRKDMKLIIQNVQCARNPI